MSLTPEEIKYDGELMKDCERDFKRLRTGWMKKVSPQVAERISDKEQELKAIFCWCGYHR